jgi:hypothetical protein
MSEQHIQICRFCQRNIKLAFYCEDCGISCCSDCLNEEKVEYFICQKCNSKNINITETGKNKVCKDCGAEHINQVTQLLKSCPKCHSHKIINVYEKKDELEKDFLDLIKNVRTFIEPLRDASNALYKLRQKVIDARAPPIKCFHYSNMEADLLSLFKLLIYAKDNLIDKIRNLIQHLSMNKDYFFNIYSQPNSNIRIIEDILANLTRTYKAIEDFIDSNVNTINKSMDPFRKNLNFIEKITLYFKKYIKFLNLAAEEKPVYAIYAKLTNGLSTQDKYKKNKGVLFITNFDLSFVHEYGKIKKKKEGIFKAPVKDLTRVKIVGKIFKRLYIEFPYGRYEFTLPPNTISKVMDYILLARSFDETIIFDENTANKLFDVEVDLNGLTNFIEEAINSFFSLKCKYNNINQNNLISGNTNNLNSGLYQNFGSYRDTNQLNLESNRFQAPNNQNINSHPLYAYFPPNNYQNYFNRPENQLLYQKNNPIFTQGNNQFQNPWDLKYYPHPIRSSYPPSYNEDDFFLQNFYDTSRIQNYRPSSYSNPINNALSAFDDKNILMRQLEKLQKPNLHGIPSYSPYSSPITDKVRFDQECSVCKDRNDNFSSFQEYSKNHLSDLFDYPYDEIINNQELKEYTSKIDKLKQKKKFELEQERYSLEATLKVLDSKFESGNISEIDYFKNFKKLQKEIYKIDKKIEDLNEEIKERESVSKFSRNLDRRRYFT